MKFWFKVSSNLTDLLFFQSLTLCSLATFPLLLLHWDYKLMDPETFSLDITVLFLAYTLLSSILKNPFLAQISILAKFPFISLYSLQSFLNKYSTVVVSVYLCHSLFGSLQWDLYPHKHAEMFYKVCTCVDISWVI